MLILAKGGIGHSYSTTYLGYDFILFQVSAISFSFSLSHKLDSSINPNLLLICSQIASFSSSVNRSLKGIIILKNRQQNPLVECELEGSLASGKARLGVKS